MHIGPRKQWILAAALTLGLGLAAAIGAWLGAIPVALAVAAIIEIVVLLSLLRHQHRAMIQAVLRIPKLRHDRFMTRSRRIATQLRDLRGAAGSLPDAVVLLDLDGRIRWFNHAASRLLGLRRPHDRGAYLSERLRGSAMGRWLAEGAQEPADDLPSPVDEAVHLNTLLIPFSAQQRLLMARDISHMMRLEQVRRDFVANVSHELRTPLTVIHGYLELLDPDDMPEMAEVLHEMRLQSRRMGQIVEDLLTLSRLETHQRTAEERVAMGPMLAMLRKEALALSQGRHEVSLEVETDADLFGSHKELHSALSNLISNAVRYTPTGGSIRIRWYRTATGAAYSVTDTGYGIPESHLARLTERFYRVSTSRSRDLGGTGLGLSIVKHVLNLHDARLDIRSEIGKGSTFTCLFDASRVLDHEPAA